MVVRIPKDIKKYKTKVVAGLTLRQVICAALAISISVPLYLYLRKTNINETVLSWIVMIIDFPLLGIGWFEVHRMPLEKYVWTIILNDFVYPPKRKYKVNLEMEEYFNDIEVKRKNEKKGSIISNRRTKGKEK